MYLCWYDCFTRVESFCNKCIRCVVRCVLEKIKSKVQTLFLRICELAGTFRRKTVINRPIYTRTKCLGHSVLDLTVCLLSWSVCLSVYSHTLVSRYVFLSITFCIIYSAYIWTCVFKSQLSTFTSFNLTTWPLMTPIEGMVFHKYNLFKKEKMKFYICVLLLKLCLIYFRENTLFWPLCPPSVLAPPIVTIMLMGNLCVGLHVCES